jgi:hypothetical protein
MMTAAASQIDHAEHPDTHPLPIHSGWSASCRPDQHHRHRILRPVPTRCDGDVSTDTDWDHRYQQAHGYSPLAQIADIRQRITAVTSITI